MLSKSSITNALVLENCSFVKHFFSASVLSSSKIIGFKKTFSVLVFSSSKIVVF